MSLGYVLKEGVAGLSRARLAAFTSIFSLFVAVLLVGVLSRVGFNAFEVIQILKQQVEVEVFLQNVDDQTTQEIRDRIEQETIVAELSYISRDSASKIFQQDFGIGSDALADLQFLPASFKVKVNENAEIAQIDSLVQQMSDYRGVDEVRFNQALLQTLESRTETLFIIGSSIGAFILFVAMILVFNTIRLTIYAKRDLIRAMKLVGATNSFIRRPFLIEGIFQGVIAGTLAASIIYILFEWVVPQIVPQLGVLSWPFGRWYFLLAAVLLLAIIMGWWGSRWAARKFIRETKVYTTN
ncbi:cell division protein FtsX [Rhodohalobacter barkolensis]|uniref:Cell division protein FtsX n=1 Tax=Rhodohalobacter barkolensis TaxID=2053187 RepID=A0A2N0VF54_9BACT|nr:permease-like cell division protein FtsX [Rhodohalobacter barkolensis]PKD42829.1 ABC transporter permease [Rhodohalobacter barkolensis]